MRDTYKIASHAIKTGKLVRPPTERARILEICSGCELLRNGFCRHDDCGCNIGTEQRGVLIGEFIAKVTYAGTSCPLGKWNEWVPPNEPIETNL